MISQINSKQKKMFFEYKKTRWPQNNEVAEDKNNKFCC